MKRTLISKMSMRIGSMQNSDKPEFKNVLVSTFEMYDKPPPSIQTLAMYYEALSHVDINDVKAGINIHVRDTDEGKFLPKPADILRGIQGNKGTQAEQAWTKVDKAIRCVGGNQSVVFDDRLIHAVIEDMGGWIALSNCDLKEYPFKHNEFVKRYSGFINKAPDRIPPKLIGSEEMHNLGEGHTRFIPQPRLIGDEKKALQVLQNESGSGRVGITSMQDLDDVKRLYGK